MARHSVLMIIGIIPGDLLISCQCGWAVLYSSKAAFTRLRSQKILLVDRKTVVNPSLFHISYYSFAVNP
jgi:hypothetical protein